eukprot:COSAG05_NODE_9848_length_597_cov_10.372126_1_plen_199_part_11
MIQEKQNGHGQVCVRAKSPSAVQPYVYGPSVSGGAAGQLSFMIQDVEDSSTSSTKPRSPKKCDSKNVCWQADSFVVALVSQDSSKRTVADVKVNRCEGDKCVVSDCSTKASNNRGTPIACNVENKDKKDGLYSVSLTALTAGTYSVYAISSRGVLVEGSGSIKFVVKAADFSAGHSEVVGTGTSWATVRAVSQFKIIGR